MREPRDRTSILALVVAVAALAGMVVAVPQILPTPVRDLVGLGPHRLAPPRHGPSSSAYTFLAHQPGSRTSPVGYDPCKKIAIKVNLKGAPPDGLALVQEAISRVEDATGLRFDYQGTTDERPQWDNEYEPTILGGVRTTPALVAWATKDEVKELSGEVVGLGGSAAVQVHGGREVYVTGGVTLDADAFASLDGSKDGRAEELAILLHEFGHLVGLGHVNDDRQIMYPDTDGSVLEYAAGDLAGLAKIGAIPCG